MDAFRACGGAKRVKKPTQFQSTPANVATTAEMEKDIRDSYSTQRRGNKLNDLCRPSLRWGYSFRLSLPCVPMFYARLQALACFAPSTSILRVRYLGPYSVSPSPSQTSRHLFGAPAHPLPFSEVKKKRRFLPSPSGSMMDQMAAKVPSSHDSSRPVNSGMVLISARTISGRSSELEPSWTRKNEQEDDPAFVRGGRGMDQDQNRSNKSSKRSSSK